MSPLVEVNGLSKSYLSGGRPLRVLRGTTFAVSRGEFVAIVGHSGSGKSTLLHLMGALDRPDQGQILFEGTDIFARRPSDIDRYRNRSVGFVFQFHHLMADFSALENVIMPALVAKTGRPHAELEGRRLLEEFGLADRVDHHPGQMSGGEQQRVAVARALMMSPVILLADEPTGNLDHENSVAVFDLLRRINRDRGLTIIMVTHNRELADCTDRVLTLMDGIVTRT